MEPVVVTAPELIVNPQGYSKLFLAGGITKCPDWQSTVINRIKTQTALIGYLNSNWGRNLMILNPRRENFDISRKEDTDIQIEWEHNALEKADVILYWFPTSVSDQPISFYELGKYSRSKNVVIGRDEGFHRKQDIDVQCGLDGLAVFKSLDHVVDVALSMCVSCLNRGAGGAMLH